MKAGEKEREVYAINAYYNYYKVILLYTRNKRNIYKMI